MIYTLTRFVPQGARSVLVRVIAILYWRRQNRVVWESIRAITYQESAGAQPEPSPGLASADVDLMVIDGVEALMRGQDARLAMIDTAATVRGQLHRLHIDQIERRARIVEEVFAEHLPGYPTISSRRAEL